MVIKEMIIDICTNNYTKLLQLEKGNENIKLHIFLKKNNVDLDVTNKIIKLKVYNNNIVKYYDATLGENNNEVIITLDEDIVGLFYGVLVIRDEILYHTKPFLLEIYNTIIVDKDNLPPKTITIRYINGEYFITINPLLKTRDGENVVTKNNVQLCVIDKIEGGL